VHLSRLFDRYIDDDDDGGGGGGDSGSGISGM